MSKARKNIDSSFKLKAIDILHRFRITGLKKFFLFLVIHSVNKHWINL